MTDETGMPTFPDHPEHRGYKMSPFTRSRIPVGCPSCRRKTKVTEARAAAA
jgi:hypothetical protein